MDGEPWCEACIADLETAARGRWPLAITFLGICGAGGAAGYRLDTKGGSPQNELLWLAFAVGALLVAVFTVLRRDPPGHGKTITWRQADDALDDPLEPETRVGHPYRARLGRVVRRVAPPLSGRATAIVMALSLALPAVALPVTLGLPRWLELEAVLGSWWLIWTAALGTLLYRGFRLSDDHVLRGPRAPWQGDSSSNGSSMSDEAWPLASGCDPGCGMVLGEGCSVVMLAVVALGLAFGAAWLVVELIAPALFFFTYLVIRAALARVANDDHGCEGRLGRALGFGALWSTLYVAPLAAVIWGVQLLL